jgi:hypothetical protein
MKRVIHKYVPYPFGSGTPHLCGTMRMNAYSGCCHRLWAKVTCKRCLRLRDKGPKDCSVTRGTFNSAVRVETE